MARRNSNAWQGYLPLFIAEDKVVGLDGTATEETQLYVAGVACDFLTLKLQETVKIGGMGRSGQFAYLVLVEVPTQGKPTLQVLWNGRIQTARDGSRFEEARKVVESELSKTATIIRAFNKKSLRAHGLHSKAGKLKLPDNG